MKKGLQCLVLLTAMLVLVALMVTFVVFLLCPDPTRAESERMPTDASSFNSGVASTIASIPGTAVDIGVPTIPTVTPDADGDSSAAGSNLQPDGSVESGLNPDAGELTTPAPPVDSESPSTTAPVPVAAEDSGPLPTTAPLPAPALPASPPLTPAAISTPIPKLPNSKPGHNFIPILMYHHFDPDPGKTGSTVMTPQTFKFQLQHLKGLGYETITTEQLHLFLTQGLDLPPKPVLITIDDGYLSTYTYAYHILKELNLKATVFAIVSFREQTDLMYPHFNWEQGREMTESGVIDIQSHTYACHYLWMDSSGCWVPGTKRLNKENQSQYERRLHDDFLLAKNTLQEKLGRNVKAVAFPYGYFDANIKKIVGQTGHSLAFSIKEGVAYPGEGLLGLPRINVPGHFTGADVEARIQWLAKQEKPSSVFCRINGEMAQEEPVFRNGVAFIPLRSFSKMEGVTLTGEDHDEDLGELLDQRIPQDQDINQQMGQRSQQLDQGTEPYSNGQLNQHQQPPSQQLLQNRPTSSSLPQPQTQSLNRQIIVANNEHALTILTGDLTVFLDGRQIDCPCYISKNTLYISVRSFAEALGYRVAWKADWFGDINLIDVSQVGDNMSNGAGAEVGTVGAEAGTEAGTVGAEAGAEVGTVGAEAGTEAGM